MVETETRPTRSEPRPDKVAAVAAIARRLRDSEAVLLTEYRGITVADSQALRRSLREAGAQAQVVKCTLARLAAAEVGHDDLVPLLEGPLALVYCETDPASPAKTLADFAKTNPALVVRGGVLGGRLLAPEAAKALAELPSRPVLLSQVAGLFVSLQSQTAGLFQSVLAAPANLVDALEAKGAPAGAPPAELPAEAVAPEPEAAESGEGPTGEPGGEAAVVEAGPDGPDSAASPRSSESPEDSAE